MLYTNITVCNEINKTESGIQILSSSLRNSIKEIIEKENYVAYDVKVNDLNTGGDNFLAKLYGIDIKGITNEGEKETNIFVKEKINFNMKLHSITELYANEELMYKELSKIFTSLQDQANVPAEDRYKVAKSYDKTNNDAIILENLTKKGFKTYDREKIISLKFAELVVQQLAKLHGLSFVIEKNMPEYFKEKIAVLNSAFHFDSDKDWKELMQRVCSYMSNLYDGKVKTKIKNFIPVLFQKFPKYHNDKTTVKCTLTHGDYKKNNIMMRAINDEPVEVIAVDYQLIDYGCPIRDFLLLTFYCTDRKFRKEHLNYLKNLYFATLSKFLKYFDIDVETVYPRKEFEKVYSEWLDYGLIASLYFSVYLSGPTIRFDLETFSLKDVPYCPDKNIEDMMKGVIDDFVQWGYL